MGFEELTKCYELTFQDVDGQDKGVVVKLTYDKLTITRPSRVELLTEGKWSCCAKFTVIDPSVKSLSYISWGDFDSVLQSVGLLI